MSKKPEQPLAAADDLFRQAMQGVTPITAPDRNLPSPPVVQFANKRSASQTQHTSPDFFSDHGANEIPVTSFLRAGLNTMTLRKLRRGQWPIQDELDLHGHTLDEARKALFQFLQHALARQYRCVNIIHGKGWQSGGNEGVLKIHTRHWLQQMPQVLAFCEPPAIAGGGGAVWVLLKSTI